MKKSVYIFTIILAILIAGCKKDNYTEINFECPTVELTDPANGATGVPTNPVITVTFNENMYPATLCDDEDPITLAGPKPVPGIVTFSGKTVSFIPSENLLPETTYTAKISAQVHNAAGIPLGKEYVWKFTTI